MLIGRRKSFAGLGFGQTFATRLAKVVRLHRRGTDVQELMSCVVRLLGIIPQNSGQHEEGNLGMAVAEGWRIQYA